MQWHQKPSKEETYSRDPSPYKIEPLSYHLGDLRDPQTFPRCSRPTSSRYSVLAGFPGCARHFLFLVSNMGQFPELTPVRSQAIESWLSTLEAGDTNGLGGQLLVLLRPQVPCQVAETVHRPCWTLQVCKPTECCSRPTPQYIRLREDLSSGVLGSIGDWRDQ